MARTPRSEPLVLQRLNTVCRWLPGARALDGRAIHQARVATRRLREALPVVTSGRERRRIEKAARRLTRALGTVRELDVALETLDELGRDGSVPRDALVKLRTLIGEERQRLQVDLQERLAATKLPKIRDRVLERETARTARPGTAVRTRQRTAKAAQRSVRRATRLRAAIDSAAGIYLPDRLHAVRIALKKLRYSLEVQTELAAPRVRRPRAAAPPRAAVARLRTLQRMQELLGRMHDLEVLIARTRALQSSAAVPDLRLSGDFDGLVRRLENECRRLHGQYMTTRAGVLAICHHVEAGGRREGRAAA